MNGIRIVKEDRELISHEETEELYSVVQLKMDVPYHPLVALWIRFQGCCICERVI